jgi:hypothetical protein
MDYIPKDDGNFRKLIEVIYQRIPTHGPVLGMSAAEITALRDSIAAHQSLHSETVSALSAARAKVRERQTSKAALKKLVRKCTRQWKAHNNFTAPMGAELSLFARKRDFDPHQYKPVLRVRVLGGKILVGFRKKGVDGVNVYGRLQGEPDWKKLGYDGSSPFVDTRPLANPHQPESREYQARGVIKDVEIGQNSNIMVITFGG